MKYIQEAPKKIPVIAETDVLVVGSGPSGLAAAIASAREGVDTMLVERYGCFGGNITQAMVESIGWYRHEGTVESEGIGLEFEAEAKQFGGERKEPQSISQVLEADIFKCVADKLVEEAGIEKYLHCLGVEAIREGNCIKGVITESKEGRKAILAKQVIDCTGDADIAFRAGVPCRQPPKTEIEGVSVSFGCSGVNRDRFMEYVSKTPGKLGQWAVETSGKEAELFSPYLAEPFAKARQNGEIPNDVMTFGTWSSITETGEATYLNMTYMLGLDPTLLKDLTHGEIEGRKQAMMAIAALRKYTPGFENARLRTFGSSLGVRESRKIIGRYTMTEDDVRNQARFHDSIGIFPEFLDAYGVVIIPTTGRYFQVPYGIIQPKGMENLLVAGRCVSGDRISHSALRQMMCCTVTGQGAGVAAAVSVKEGVSTGNVNIEHVQNALIKQGVRIN
ncbi:Invasion protein IbeA [Desulfamplus magnetovallimortis]|uniref:Invasion protein IbeA n=1 Tax=Desulfamplus magnetovallimortis TaxID=1246637 RepID=A0A1W1HHQ1_9BACT|nr:FAD-dependent oxidoreductase [Desulfamplus magnetovallimortis]SLM31966.1 Invasion protein IbeA [Desulfamplus magnetovallimortis]